MCKWIAGVLARTTADRVMIDDLAVSVQTTQSWARIITFLINASQMNRAFRADETLRTTMRRSAMVTRTA